MKTNIPKTIVSSTMIFLCALALNLLKGFLERSKKSFNKFRTSAGNLNSFFLILFISPLSLTGNDATTIHNYLWANYNHFSGNVASAQNWYTKLFSSNPSIYSYKGYLNVLSDTNSLSNAKKIIELIPSLQEKFSNDPDVQLIFVKAFEKTNQIKKADDLIITLSQSFKTNSEIALRASQTYIRRQESENALITINNFLNNTPHRPNNFVFYFLKTNIYIQLNQYPQALDNVQKCLEIHPQFDRGWLLCASLKEKEGNLKEAITGYATFLELSGGNKQIEQHLFQLMLRHKALEENKPFFLSHNISIDNALLLFKQQRYAQALTHINSCIEQQPTNNECKLLKLQILSALKDFNQIATVASEWIIAQPDNDLWPKSLCLLVHNNMPHAQITQTFANILNKTPDNLWCNLYCADMHMRNAQPNQAITSLTNALTCTMNDTLRTKTLYQLGLLQYEQGNHDAMRTHLESAYALNSENAHINNTLAYYWATKGKNTTKAHSFITKALTSNAANPYFLDTQALILYKEKQYDKAQQILEPLAQHNNSTMLLHLAKVHYALNNTENADTFTKQAASLVKNNSEKKTLHKMQLRLTQT